MSNFDPTSTDSMFATILAELKELNSKSDRIESQALLTNGRVNGLERWRDIVTAKVAGIALAVSTIVSVVAYFVK